MEKKTSSQLIKRLFKLAIVSLVLLMIPIYFFTKSMFYSIIFCSGAIISISGFVLMIKMTDRALNTGKGQLLFAMALFVKLGVIALSVYLVSRVSVTAVFFHILGLSIIVIAIGMEGIYQFFHSRNKKMESVFNGRA
jgi:membrane-associated HD superfamily phosphohydrolase